MALGKQPNRRLAPFYERLGEGFDHFARRGTTLLHMPNRHMIAGFSFQPVSYDPNLRYLYYFVQTLFEPVDYIVLSYGSRIPDEGPVPIAGTAEELAVTIGAMRTEGLRNLAELSSLQGIYDALDRGRFRRGMGDYYIHEMLFCISILQGREPATIQRHLSDAKRLLGGSKLADYERNLLERLNLLEGLMCEGGVVGAQAQILKWEDEAVGLLGITDLAEKSAPDSSHLH